MTEFPDGLPDEAIRPVPKVDDGNGHYLIFTGGLRAALFDDGKWMVEPVLSEGEAVGTGMFSKNELEKFAKTAGVRSIGFHRFGWADGIYSSSWSPIISGQSNHRRGPADRWGDIASNLSLERESHASQDLDFKSDDELAKYVDDRPNDELLPLYISASLRSLDRSIEQISEFYFEQLVNAINSGDLADKKVWRQEDRWLYAEVHSFFLQIGSARDYFGSYLALSLGWDPKKEDSLEKVRRKLRGKALPDDPMLGLLIEQGLLLPPTDEPKKEWHFGGWLRQLIELRNRFVHKRPYGSMYKESFGWAISVDSKLGLYRYTRPIVLEAGKSADLLDLLRFHYSKFQTLLNECAELSGMNAEMITLTDADFINVEVTSWGGATKKR